MKKPESDTDIEIDATLDASGLLCPEPVLRARQQLARMRPGQILALTATDPLADVDIETFCQRTDHELLVTQTLPEATRFLIRRG